MLKLVLALTTLALPLPLQAQTVWQVGPLDQGDSLNLRSGPSPSFPEHGKLRPAEDNLKKDICVRLTEDRGRAVPSQPEWCHLSRDGRPLGWVAARYLLPHGLPFVRGYRNVQDSCMLIGESAGTIDFLDDSADLVGCPDAHGDITGYKARGAKEMARIAGYTLMSIPRR